MATTGAGRQAHESIRAGTLRRFVKNVTYGLLLHSGEIARARSRNRRYARILLYHSISPEEGLFTRGLDVTVKPDTFAKQLDYLCRHYRVVTLSELAPTNHPKGVVCTPGGDHLR